MGRDVCLRCCAALRCAELVGGNCCMREQLPGRLALPTTQEQLFTSSPTQIAESDQLEEGVRCLAAEFLVTLCEAREKAPGMMRKLPQVGGGAGGIANV